MDAHVSSSPSSTDTTPPTPTAMPPQHPSPASLSNFVQSISKLTKINYLVWYRQVEANFLGHDLYGFMDGTKTPPHVHSSTSDDGSITISTDPETLQWFRQDQLILSMLMSTIFDELLPQVFGCRTAQELNWQNFCFHRRSLHHEPSLRPCYGQERKFLYYRLLSSHQTNL
jgi:hypothetical protein